MLPIVRWQYEQLEGEAGLLEDHLADPSCPCESQGEACPRKHLKKLMSYALETAIILEREGNHREEVEKLYQLAGEARRYKAVEERKLCGERVREDELVTTAWASKWRKYFENKLVRSCLVQLSETDFGEICTPSVVSLPKPGTRGTIVEPYLYYDCACDKVRCAIVPIPDTGEWMIACGMERDGVRNVFTRHVTSMERAKKFVVDWCEEVKLGEGGDSVEFHEEVGTLPAAVEEARAEVRRIVEERRDSGEMSEMFTRVAEKHDVPRGRLIRETMKGLKLVKLDTTYRLSFSPGMEIELPDDVVQSLLEDPEAFGPILAPEEAAIPEFGEKFERCVLHLKPAEEKGLIQSAYAVCRASLRRAYGLPVGKESSLAELSEEAYYLISALGVSPELNYETFIVAVKAKNAKQAERLAKRAVREEGYQPVQVGVEETFSTLEELEAKHKPDFVLE